MGLKEVKAELQNLDKETLIKHIAELYKKYKPVKEYFEYFVNPNEKDILRKYKEQVREGFFPKRGYQFRLSISRKAISDFRKLGTSSEGLCELLLYFVECGVELTTDYGDIDENFYISMENTFHKALKAMDSAGVLKKFKNRALKIVNGTEHMGWGFHDGLSDVYMEFFEI